jgi:uncharacterized membrane protein
MSTTGRQAAANHRLYIITILAKGALGLIQLATAAAIYLGVLPQLPRLAKWLVEHEISEDPNDFFASHILALANIIPTSSPTFYTIYFSAHGLMHVTIVAALLWGARWAYHGAVIVLSGFIIYQLVEWFSVGGYMLLILSAIDLAVIYLTVRENRRLET